MKNWQNDLNIVVLAVSILITGRCSTKRDNGLREIVDLQSELIGKLAKNQGKIVQRLGLSVGSSLDEIKKKVDLDSAGN